MFNENKGITNILGKQVILCNFHNSISCNYWNHIITLVILYKKDKKLHVEAIEKRNSYLGIHKEKLDALNNLKRSIKETLKFNVATVVTSIIQSLIAILHSLSSHENVFMVSATLALFLFLKLSNLLSIILTHSKIRKEIKILCHSDSCLYTEN